MRSLTFLLLILLSFCAHAQQSSPIFTHLTTRNLIEGEIAYFNLIYRDVNPKQAPPETIKLNGHTLVQRGYQSRYNGRDRYYIYSYPIVNIKPGKYTIPSIELTFQGKTIKSEPAKFTVVALDQLALENRPTKHGLVPVYSKIFVDKDTLYPGETVEATYKIYLPAEVTPRDWGLPKPIESKNCTAWRFEPPKSLRESGQAYINHKLYEVATYKSTISALSEGPLSFGPLETELVIAPQTMHSRFGPTRHRTTRIQSTSSPLHLQVLPFPTSPPESFKGAIGQFTLEADLPAKESLSLNDSITATVTVEGSGNLPSITAPELEDTATWKVVDVSRVQQGDERKNLSGKAQFTYILRPLRGADALPRFSFSHFDPVAKEFFTDITTTSALKLITPEVTSAAILPNTEIPKEAMNDILGPLSQVRLTTPNSNTLATIPVWSWHALPLSVCLIMLIGAGIKKAKNTKATNPNKQQRMLELKEVSSSNDANFLKQAGAFAEKWFTNDPRIREIVELRDQQCYQPDHSKAIDKKKRNSILQLLKSLSVICLIAALTIPSSTQAAAEHFEAWQDGEYQAALEGYLTESEQHPNSADLLYNVGATYFRTNEPGKAALYFEKALAIDPNHYEAQKNLTFTHKAQGSILAPARTEMEAWIMKLPPLAYQQLAFAGCWILFLSLLAVKIYHLRGTKLILPLSLCLLSPALITVSAVAWFKHPTRVNQEIGEAGVITQFTHVLTEPIEVSGKELEKKTMIKATPASPCRIIAVRGAWSYIELANGTRGWAPNTALGTI